jgi:hypothetical protein
MAGEIQDSMRPDNQRCCRFNEAPAQSRGNLPELAVSATPMFKLQ